MDIKVLRTLLGNGYFNAMAMYWVSNWFMDIFNVMVRYFMLIG